MHGHWLLARLARTFPDAPFTPKAIEALQQSLTRANLEAEARYLNGEGRASFERPYGLAWLLQLGQELRELARRRDVGIAVEHVPDLVGIFLVDAGKSERGETFGGGEREIGHGSWLS